MLELKLGLKRKDIYKNVFIFGLFLKYILLWGVLEFRFCYLKLF